MLTWVAFNVEPYFNFFSTFYDIVKVNWWGILNKAITKQDGIAAKNCLAPLYRRFWGLGGMLIWLDWQSVIEAKM